MTTASPTRGFRFSLRGLLTFVVAIALGCASLKFANEWWLAAIAGSALLGLMASVVVASVDRGPRQAFAFGFAVFVTIYGVVVLSCRKIEPGFNSGSGTVNNEMEPYRGILPTTRLLRSLFEAVVSNRWLDPTTGKEIPDYDPSRRGTVSGLAAFTGPQPTLHENPSREQFMPIGHCLWALGLGYVGGHFSLFIYARCARDQASARVT